MVRYDIDQRGSLGFDESTSAARLGSMYLGVGYRCAGVSGLAGKCTTAAVLPANGCNVAKRSFQIFSSNYSLQMLLPLVL